MPYDRASVIFGAGFMGITLLAAFKAHQVFDTKSTRELLIENATKIGRPIIRSANSTCLMPASAFEKSNVKAQNDTIGYFIPSDSLRLQN